MPDTLEHMQALDATMQQIASLLTQAVQATEHAADVITNQIPNGKAPSLVEALPHLQQALNTALQGHQMLTSNIQEAKREIETQVQNGTYVPDEI